jgi:hypothetical protein
VAKRLPFRDTPDKVRPVGSGTKNADQKSAIEDTDGQDKILKIIETKFLNLETMITSIRSEMVNLKSEVNDMKSKIGSAIHEQSASISDMEPGYLEPTRMRGRERSNSMALTRKNTHGDKQQ